MRIDIVIKNFKKKDLEFLKGLLESTEDG